jgi:hypothetical protein
MRASERDPGKRPSDRDANAPDPVRRSQQEEVKRVRRDQSDEVKREVGEAGSASPDDRDERFAGRGFEDDRKAARGVSRGGSDERRGTRSRGIGPSGPTEAKGVETPPEA